MSARHVSVSRLPAELLDQIFAHLYADLQPAPSLDARIDLLPRAAPAVSYDGHLVFARSPRDQAIIVFSRFCLVSRTWAQVAQPYLFRHIRVDIPRQFEALLDAIAEPEFIEEREGRSTTVHGIKHPLITPPRSRHSSRSPHRAMSRERFQGIESALRSVSLDSAMSRSSSSQHPSPPHLPGLHVESLSFASFRTVGMRRTLREGSQQRFVTTSRVLRLLQGTRSVGLLSTQGELQDPYLEPDEDPHEERGHLTAVGMTEYMDSALQREVLDELLLRGGVEVGPPEAFMLRGSPAALASTSLTALDLCGCVSARFIEGITAFVEANGLGTSDGFRFPHLRRLGLFSVHISAPLLEAFVSAFTELTHLDLGNTRATVRLLHDLTSKAPRLRLQSLSLARCKSLTSEGLRDFFLGGRTPDGQVRNATSDLTELSLYGDESAPMALQAEHLLQIFLDAPCFRSKRLRFLDLGTAPLTAALLGALPPQPALVDLGVAYLWDAIALDEFTSLLRDKVPNLEVLEMTDTCMTRARGSVVNVMDLHRLLINQGPRTLRVIELDDATLKAIAGGAGKWKVVYGKGTRGYYVDTQAKGPQMEAALREIVRDERLTPSVLGWHPRKMEVLSGHGMQGREDGLYAFHAFQVR